MNECCDNMEFDPIDVDAKPETVPCKSCGHIWTPLWDEAHQVSIDQIVLNKEEKE